MSEREAWNELAIPRFHGIVSSGFHRSASSSSVNRHAYYGRGDLYVADCANGKVKTVRAEKGQPSWFPPYVKLGDPIWKK